MAFDNDHRHPPIALDTQDLLSIDSFAEEAPSATAVARPYHAASSDALFKRHVRSRTEEYTYSDATGGQLHPLRSAGLANGSGDAGITRPHLSRIVKVGTLVDAPAIQSDNTSDISSLSDEAKDVLVHKIDSKDSLAGVSLKYGISMADLRRANHLWASDSIHFRKALYIPLEKASRAPQLQKDYNLISATPSEDSPNPMEAVDDISPHSTDKESLSNEHDVRTIRRIPASQLSFFPPPSLKDTMDVSAHPSPRARVTPAPDRPSYQTHNRLASSPSLTSILTALPIAASTRDTIIARLSFDSLSSSYSDRDEAEHPHDGLELDDVGHVLSSKGLANNLVNAHDRRYPHPSTSQATGLHAHPTAKPSVTSQIKPRADHPSVTPNASKFSTRHSGQREHLSDFPKAYIPSHQHIRTAQLEPSPEMQLPLSKASISQSKGRKSIRARSLDVDFEMEDTQNSLSSSS
ncbi:hypothetical protein L208DRAFT_1391487 [Tricholoma matsutake]|nr:hypothetical protein L208DRAFT_1391487 [Tricholoma matsutake 945]